MGESVRTHVIVRGLVQGVWFRESCRATAVGLGLSGYVRNLEDGTVEAEFEGAAAAVARAVDWCRSGPPSARVTGVETSAVPAIGEKRFVVA